MSFVIAVIVAMAFLEWPWRLLVIVPAAALELFEISLWLKWRKVRSITGSEAMVGATGVAVSDIAPEGQVRVKGQLWKARARERIAAGTAIEVSAVEGISLDVMPRRSPLTSRSPATHDRSS